MDNLLSSKNFYIKNGSGITYEKQSLGKTNVLGKCLVATQNLIANEIQCGGL
jgi:hypothetical protein